MKLILSYIVQLNLVGGQPPNRKGHSMSFFSSNVFIFTGLSSLKHIFENFILLQRCIKKLKQNLIKVQPDFFVSQTNPIFKHI